MRASRILTSRGIFAIVSLVTFTAACSDQEEPTGIATSAQNAAPSLSAHHRRLHLTVTPQVDTLIAGDTMRFTATVSSRRGILQTPPRIYWQTNDVAVATVSEIGTVRARQPGRASIIAYAGDLRDTSQIYVVRSGNQTPPTPGPGPEPTPGPTPTPVPIPPTLPTGSLRGIAPNMPAGFAIFTSRDFSTKARHAQDITGAQGWDTYEWSRTHVEIGGGPHKCVPARQSTQRHNRTI